MLGPDDAATLRAVASGSLRGTCITVLETKGDAINVDPQPEVYTNLD